MTDEALQKQFQQTHQTKKDNSQLTVRYKRYLERTLGVLSTPTHAPDPSQPESSAPKSLETPLSAKVEVIYANEDQLQRQRGEIEQRLKDMDATSKELNNRLEHTRQKMAQHKVIKVSPRGEIEDVMQRRAETLDQRIRILENTMRAVERDGSRPAVAKRRGLFG